MPALAIACPVATNATLGQEYTGTLIATGGTPAYTFAIISGSLPPGITLDTATGIISGIPTGIGPYSYIAQVTDSLGATAHT